MSDVPLPEPDFYCAPKSGKILSVQGYERGDHLQGLMRGHYEPVYYGHKLDAHAAAVSADLRAENARLRERMGRLEEVLRIVRQYPDFDGGGPMPDMIDDELNGKPSVMLEGMRNITTKPGSQP